MDGKGYKNTLLYFITGKRPIAKSKEVVKPKADELEEDDSSKSSADIDKPTKKLKLVVYGDSDSDND